jgi:hypothetical protein
MMSNFPQPDKRHLPPPASNLQRRAEEIANEYWQRSTFRHAAAVAVPARFPARGRAQKEGAVSANGRPAHNAVDYCDMAIYQQ